MKLKGERKLASDTVVDELHGVADADADGDGDVDCDYLDDGATMPSIVGDAAWRC